MWRYRKEQRKTRVLFFAISLSGLISAGTYWAHHSAFMMPICLLAIMLFPFCMALYFVIKQHWIAMGIWLFAFTSGSLFSPGMAAWYIGIARA